MKIDMAFLSKVARRQNEIIGPSFTWNQLCIRSVILNLCKSSYLHRLVKQLWTLDDWGQPHVLRSGSKLLRSHTGLGFEPHHRKESVAQTPVWISYWNLWRHISHVTREKTNVIRHLLKENAQHSDIAHC